MMTSNFEIREMSDWIGNKNSVYKTLGASNQTQSYMYADVISMACFKARMSEIKAK